MNDGSHGWTLVSVPVEHGEDWPTIASEGVEQLLGVPVSLEQEGEVADDIRIFVS